MRRKTVYLVVWLLFFSPVFETVKSYAAPKKVLLHIVFRGGDPDIPKGADDTEKLLAGWKVQRIDVPDLSPEEAKKYLVEKLSALKGLTPDLGVVEGHGFKNSSDTGSLSIGVRAGAAGMEHLNSISFSKIEEEVRGSFKNIPLWVSSCFAGAGKNDNGTAIGPIGYSSQPNQTSQYANRVGISQSPAEATTVLLAKLLAAPETAREFDKNRDGILSAKELGIAFCKLTKQYAKPIVISSVKEIEKRHSSIPFDPKGKTEIIHVEDNNAFANTLVQMRDKQPNATLEGPFTAFNIKVNLQNIDSKEKYELPIQSIDPSFSSQKFKTKADVEEYLKSRFTLDSEQRIIKIGDVSYLGAAANSFGPIVEEGKWAIFHNPEEGVCLIGERQIPDFATFYLPYGESLKNYTRPNATSPTRPTHEAP